ncbi:MAG TPA: transglycosylase SLT domain-containing protein [Rhodocyclaceae bacterium]|nr:transglycosylase SLT domain-containing protein [Rhodocyclaceae bacterium]
MPHRPVPSRLSGFRLTTAVAATLLALSAHAEAESSTVLALFLSNDVASPVEANVEASAEETLSVHELQAAPQLPGAIDLTAETDDLWQRMRNGFAMPNLNNDLVLYHQQWYQNRPELLRRIVERSRRYMHHIVEELEKRGMPTELALLPMVESAYNPMAQSPAQASGLWQFIPSTGKTYKLEQNWWQDQRRDIVASTAAALEYLQTIYEMQGDWHLALASYNWGEGAVKRAMEKNAAKGLPTDYSSLNMPNETRNYVPKLQALKNIFSNPRLMAELRLPEILNRPYFATVESNRPIDVTTAAKLAGMPLNEFVALNPSHNRPQIKPATPLVIPADKVGTFQANLEMHDEPLSRWQTYTLKPGEKLDKLAPRFGISLADLKRVNGVQGRLKISAGSTLLVPATRGDATDDVPEQPRLPQIASTPAGRKHQLAAKGDHKLAKGEPVKSAKLAKVEKTRVSKVAVAVAKPAAKVAAKAAPVKVAAKRAPEKKTIVAAPVRSPAKIVRSGGGRRA